MLCARCDRDNPADGRFCVFCGAELTSLLRLPVRVDVAYPGRLSRRLLLVKWLLAIPLLIVWVFYSIAAYLLTFVSFWVILFTGRYPEGMFRFAKGYQSFQFKVLAPTSLTSCQTHGSPTKRTRWSTGLTIRTTCPDSFLYS